MTLPRDGEWHTSSFSAYDGNCFRVRRTFLTVALSDSKDPDGPILPFDPDVWQAFVDAVKGDALLP